MNYSKSVLRSNPRLVPPDTLLKFGISPNASIEFDSAASALSFSYSGSPKADIGSFGMALRDGEGLVVGHPSQLAMGGNTPEVQVLGTGSSDGRISVGVFEGTDAALRPVLEFVRSRATTIGGSNVIVQDNDALAQLEFYADDGVDLTTKAAAFEVEVDDGSPAENAVGAAIILKTMTTGGALAEALRIDSSQNVGLKATGKLYFDGTGNTYIYEESGDDLHIVVGGQTYMQIDQDLAAGAGGMAIGQNAAPEANGRKHIQIGGTWTASSSGDFGQMVNVGGVLTLDPGVTAHAETLQVSGQIHTQGSSQTIANIASLAVQEPSITVNSGDTVTRASTLYMLVFLLRDRQPTTESTCRQEHLKSVTDRVHLASS